MQEASEIYTKEPPFNKYFRPELLNDEQAVKDFVLDTFLKEISQLMSLAEQKVVSPDKVVGVFPLSWFIIAHAIEGVQMRVTKAVTRDLILSDFSGSVKNSSIAWPARSVEVFFEDDNLPTILLSRYSLRSLMQTLKLHEIVSVFDKQAEADEVVKRNFNSTRLSAVLWKKNYETINGETIVISHNIQLDGIDEINYEPVILAFNEKLFSDSEFFHINLIESDQREYLYSVASLAFRAFAFASIPAFRPAKVQHKEITKKQGGKAEFMGRPVLPVLRVIYAPSIIHERSASVKTGKTRQFKGRRGHFHFYKSDRFVNRKGTWDYYPPIYVTENNTKTVYVVRKP